MFEVLCLVVISMRSLFCVSRMDFVKYLNIYSTLSLILSPSLSLLVDAVKVFRTQSS